MAPIKKRKLEYIYMLQIYVVLYVISQIILFLTRMDLHFFSDYSLRCAVDSVVRPSHLGGPHDLIVIGCVRLLTVAQYAFSHAGQRPTNMIDA
jgi:hypothetical protein